MKPDNDNDLRAALASQIVTAGKVNQSVQDLLDALKADWARKLWIPYSSGALVKDAQIATRPVVVRMLAVYNANAGSVWYAQAHNAGLNPGVGQIAILPPMPVLQNTLAAFDLPKEGVVFSNGLYVCGSSTDVGKTLITTTDLFIYALYRFA